MAYVDAFNNAYTSTPLVSEAATQLREAHRAFNVGNLQVGTAHLDAARMDMMMMTPSQQAEAIQTAAGDINYEARTGKHLKGNQHKGG